MTSSLPDTRSSGAGPSTGGVVVVVVVVGSAPVHAAPLTAKSIGLALLPL
ncbi:hypothetical protein [Saccharothrix luteola]|nr:hypothetical protein [Saccharothrix luteola]MCC8251514.1 hypothetical protein [Saccharothrix luteola]